MSAFNVEYLWKMNNGNGGYFKSLVVLIFFNYKSYRQPF